MRSVTKLVLLKAFQIMKKCRHVFRFGVAILLGVTLFSGCGTSPRRAPDGKPTTILLLLHAEADPVYVDRLSGKGHERAKALTGAVSDFKVAAVYCPSHRRNIQTAKPLADQLGIDIKLMPTHRGFYRAYEARQLLEKLMENHAGETILWVGADQSVKALYEALGGPTKPPVNAGELVAVTLSGQGVASETRRRFGD